MGVMNPGLVMRNVIPVVMAGILGIYGLIVAVILNGNGKSVCLPPSILSLMKPCELYVHRMIDFIEPLGCRDTLLTPSIYLTPPLFFYPFLTVKEPTKVGTEYVATYSSYSGFAHLAAGLACGLR